MNLNKVILIGRISTDISNYDSKSGINYVRFNLAITRDNVSSNNREEITDFIPMVAFRNNATYISRFFNKGDLVNIVGMLQNSQYTSKNGDIVSSTNVVIDNIKSLEPRSVTQARAERNNTTIANVNISNSANNDQPTFYDDEQNKNDSNNNDDENPWEIDF